MVYRHAPAADHVDLAPGHMLAAAPGQATLPLRFASELLQRAVALYDRRTPYLLLTPGCGDAATVTALGFLHGDRMAHIIALEQDPPLCTLARRNLSLLTGVGLSNRQREVAEPAVGVARRLAQRQRALTFELHCAPARDRYRVQRALGARRADVALCIIPTTWRDATGKIDQLLSAIYPVLSPQAIVILAGEVRPTPSHDGYFAADRLRLGRYAADLLRRL